MRSSCRKSIASRQNLSGYPLPGWTTTCEQDRTSVGTHCLGEQLHVSKGEPQWVPSWPIAWVNNYMWARENLSGYPLPGWTTTCEQGRTSVGTHCLGEQLHVNKTEPQWVPIAWVNNYMWARQNLSGYPLPGWTTTCEQGRTSVGTHCLGEQLHVNKTEPQWVPIAWVNNYMWARQNLSGYPLPGWTTTCEQDRTSVGTHCLGEQLHVSKTEPQWVPIAWVNNYMWARQNLSGYPLPGWTTACEQDRTSVGTRCLGEQLHVSKTEPQWVPVAWVNNYMWARQNLSGYPLPGWTTTCEQDRTSVGTHGWTTTCEQDRTSVGTHCLGEQLHVSKTEPQWVPIAWVNNYMWARQNLSGYPLPGWTTTCEQDRTSVGTRCLGEQLHVSKTEPQWVPVAWVNHYMWARQNLSGYPLPGWTTTCEQDRTSVGTHCLGEQLHVSKTEPQWVPVAWVNHYMWARQNLSGYPLPGWTTTCEQDRTSVGTHCLGEQLHVSKTELQWVPIAWVNNCMWARQNLSGYPLPGWTTTCEQGRTSVGTRCLGEPLHVGKGEPQWVPIAWMNHYMWAKQNLSGYPLPEWTTTWEQVVC